MNRVAYGYDYSLLGRTDDAILEEDRPVWWAACARAMSGESDVPYSLRIKTTIRPGWARLVGRLSGAKIDGSIKYVIAVVYDQSITPESPCVNCSSRKGEPGIPEPRLVTLSQMAALVHRKPSALRKHPDLPPPLERGTRGQPSVWRYVDVREWLEKRFGVKLPVEFPFM